MNVPFYVAVNQVLAGTPGRTYECRYFRSQQEAIEDCSEIPGAYVIESSPGTIWRATVPEQA